MADLSDVQARAVLSIKPRGARITRAAYFDNYNLPCPIKVDVQLPDGGLESVVVRTTRHGSVELEALLLEALMKIDFPAPEVLAAHSAARSQTNHVPS